MVNVSSTDVSTPPFAVPALSLNTTFTVEVPDAFGAGVMVKLPLGSINGPIENSAGFVKSVTLKFAVWPDSSAGPGEILVAQWLMVCSGVFSSTTTFGPLVKVGASFTEVMLMVNTRGPEV